MDDIRYAEMRFLAAVHAGDFNGTSSYYSYSDPKHARFGIQHKYFEEMVQFTLEHMLIEVNNEEVRRLVCKINGEGGHCPSGIDGNDWAYPRSGVASRLRHHAHQLTLTYRGLRRIEELRAELQKDRILDPMGIVLDARYFDPDLTRAMMNSGSTVVVVRIDMDHLKAINNEHGHLIGNEAIRSYLTLAKSLFEKWGDVYRMGGDEAAVIIPHQPLSKGAELARAFLTQLKGATITTKEGKRIPLSASLGVAASPPSSRDPHALHAEADACQLKAKEQGRGRVVVSALTA